MKAITAVGPADGFELWHQVTCRSYSLTECRRAVDRRFRARISMREVGGLPISALTTAAPPDDVIRATRGPAEIRRDPRDYFMLWLMLDGQVGLAQNGRSTLMRAGDLFVYDQSQPFVLEFSPRWRALMVTIPRPLLVSRLPQIHQLAGHRIAAGSSLGAFAGSLVGQLYRLDDDTRQDIAHRLGASALDMLATTLEAEAGPQTGSANQQRRLAQTKEYILANLDDPDLDLRKIAAAQDIAPRTLYRLFAEEGTTPIRWLWQQRLAAGYRALNEGKVTQVTDAALSCGFSDVSHFSRTFRAAFGQSPRMFRRRHG